MSAKAFTWIIDFCPQSYTKLHQTHQTKVVTGINFQNKTESPNLSTLHNRLSLAGTWLRQTWPSCTTGTGRLALFPDDSVK